MRTLCERTPTPCASRRLRWGADIQTVGGWFLGGDPLAIAARGDRSWRSGGARCARFVRRCLMRWWPWLPDAPWSASAFHWRGHHRRAAGDSLPWPRRRAAARRHTEQPFFLDELTAESFGAAIGGNIPEVGVDRRVTGRRRHDLCSKTDAPFLGRRALLDDADARANVEEQSAKVVIVRGGAGASSPAYADPAAPDAAYRGFAADHAWRIHCAVVGMSF